MGNTIQTRTVEIPAGEHAQLFDENGYYVSDVSAPEHRPLVVRINSGCEIVLV